MIIYSAVHWQKEASDIPSELWMFIMLPSVLFFQARFYESNLILLRDMLGKTSWYAIDVSGNDKHILLSCKKKKKKKNHFCHLLSFTKVGQYCQWGMWHHVISPLTTESNPSMKPDPEE